ncbi:MAG: phosphotransferase [Candidatus Eremiobacteraeota bacterium]|nr:phosphotransferase [Candidatus Eremiobacteraeota bacterium]
MQQPWKPERVVDAGLAGRLIGHQFPELAGLELEDFGQGWDNTAYLVGREWVFRFPRRQLAVELLENEIRWLPWLAGRLGEIRLSAPLWIGQPVEDFPWPFAGYPLVPGQTVDRWAAAPSERRALAEDLGAFLGELHRLPIPPDLPSDPCRRFVVEGRYQEALGRLEFLYGRKRLAHQPDWEAMLKVTLEPPAPTVFLHGDLYARHLVVGQNRLSGVIDWGDLHQGRCSTDLCAGLTLFDAPARRRFAQAYGKIETHWWAQAFFRALTHGLGVLAYAVESADEVLGAEGSLALDNLLAAWRRFVVEGQPY